MADFIDFMIKFTVSGKLKKVKKKKKKKKKKKWIFILDFMKSMLLPLYLT